MATHHEDTHTDEAPPRFEVIGESDRNEGVRVVRVHRPEAEEASYLSASVKGIGVTVKHFFKNFGVNFLRKKEKTSVETINYPEQKIAYPERNRGLHRLMKRDDGRVRCVACMCCPTVCPADCITIVPAETDDAGVEKYPAVFEIDELRCVVCGLCVEACPCDAIRMDTGLHAEPVYERGKAILGRDQLLAIEPVRDTDATSTAVQGGKGSDWRDRD